MSKTSMPSKSPIPMKRKAHNEGIFTAMKRRKEIQKEKDNKCF